MSLGKPYKPSCPEGCPEGSNLIGSQSSFLRARVQLPTVHRGRATHHPGKGAHSPTDSPHTAVTAVSIPVPNGPLELFLEPHLTINTKPPQRIALKQQSSNSPVSLGIFQAFEGHPSKANKQTKKIIQN